MTSLTYSSTRQAKPTASGNPARRVLSASLACVALLATAGCRQDMHNQPKMYPQRGTTFYADGRSVRPQVQDTVARNQGDAGSYMNTGMVNGKEGDGLPLPLTPELLERGQERYNIYCTACHSRVGNGAGVIVMRGYRPAGNFHTDRLRQAPLGHFFNVITNGYGAMPDYAAQVTVQDRWAIAAYIRALQLSQNATQADAGGAPLEKLADVAQREGLPRGFAKAWELPKTAVYGTPDDQDHGIPGNVSDAGGRNVHAQSTGVGSEVESPVKESTGSSANPPNQTLPEPKMPY